ncbi:FeoB small GTPase domain-containing protein [Chloroflexota bacterium]
MRILLMGNPNVGKSVIFSRLTGLRATISNYPGTTVSFLRGFMKLGDEQVEVIDVPGTYSLDPTNKAEEVACQLVPTGDLVINVVDAAHLERSLYLTLELQERRIPMVVALNMWDDARHQGVDIDVAGLESRLGVPVVPTVAVTGEGVRDMVLRLGEARANTVPQRGADERWAEVGSILGQVQQIEHRHHTWRDRLHDVSVHPVGGLMVAAVVLFGSFWLVRLIGEGIIGYVTDPLFDGVYGPALLRLSSLLGGQGFWHDVLVGKLVEGDIDFTQSFGVLTTGVYIPIGAVLPYVITFYLVLGLLEDTGYLPRLATLLDTLMHRLGLHGYAIIPTLLGLGCNVPAILATRILESQKERFIAATLISVAVPCAALQAMVIGLVGARGMQYVALVYGSLFLVWLVLGNILNLAIRGFRPELIIEMPPYRLPPWYTVLLKLWTRVYWFVREALPFILLGALAISVLDYFGAFDAVAKVASPLVTGVWGLPQNATAAVVIGFLRKDLALGMLQPLNLSTAQLVTEAVVLSVFFPCVASFLVLARELGVRDLLKAVGVMVAVAVAAGGLLNLAL